MSRIASYRIAPRPKMSQWLEEQSVPEGSFPREEVVWQISENQFLEWERQEYNSLAKLIFLAHLAVEFSDQPWAAELLGNRVLDDELVDRNWEFEFQESAPAFPDHYIDENHGYFTHDLVRGRLVSIGRQRVQEYIERKMKEGPGPGW